MQLFNDKRTSLFSLLLNTFFSRHFLPSNLPLSFFLSLSTPFFTCANKCHFSFIIFSLYPSFSTLLSTSHCHSLFLVKVKLMKRTYFTLNLIQRNFSLSICRLRLPNLPSAVLSSASSSSIGNASSGYSGSLGSPSHKPQMSHDLRIRQKKRFFSFP